MARIAIARAYKPIGVDLWGEDFDTVDVPRSGAKKASELEAELKEVEDEDQDGAVDLIAALLDIKLASTNGKATKASTIIKRKWKADELSVDALFGFLRNLGEAESDRPT